MLRLQLRDDPRQYVSLSAASTTVGSDAGNVMVVDEPQVADFHAEIAKQEDGRLFIVDLLSSTGTYVNGDRVSGRRELAAWDVIRVGNVELEINDPNAQVSREWALVSGEGERIVLGTRTLRSRR